MSLSVREEHHPDFLYGQNAEKKSIAIVAQTEGNSTVLLSGIANN